MFKAVGTYENVDIVCCGSCGHEVVRVCRTVSSVAESLEEEKPDEPWPCPACGVDRRDNASSVYSKRFSCPDCGKENVQRLEPMSVSQDADARLFFYQSDRLTCMYCEAEFGLYVLAPDVSDPATWKNVLHRIENNHEQGEENGFDSKS